MAEPTIAATPAPSSTPPPAAGDDWANRTTDFIVEKVDEVAGYTATPARVASRGLVYGIVLAALIPTLIVLSLIFLVRFLNVYIPGDVYYVYLGLGTLFTIPGVVLMHRATTAS